MRGYLPVARDGFRRAFDATRYEDTQFVHGLRAWAALGVLLIHSGGGGLRELGGWGNRLVDLGSAGVYVFFVISGFAVSSAWKKQPMARLPFFYFLQDRLARIVPLYYFWLLVAISFGLTALWWQEYFGVQVDAYNVLLHLTFLSTFDGAVANSILGVEWTLPIEVFYYLLIPGLVALFVRKPLLGPIFLGVGVFAWAGVHLARDFSLLTKLELQALLFSPLPYLLSFVTGVLVSQYRDSSRVSRFRGSWPLLVIGFWLFLWVVFSPPFLRSVDRYIWVTALAALVILLAKEGAWPVWLLLSNRVAVFVGSMSYGIYLSHFVILRLVFVDALPLFPKLFVSLTLAVGISLLTWIFLEYPIIRAVKKQRGARSTRLFRR